MGCLWALAMNLPLWALAAFLGSLCTPVGLVVGILLGAKGNELAWKHRRFDSIEHFRKVQQVWAVVGISLTVFVVLVYAALAALSVFIQ